MKIVLKQKKKQIMVYLYSTTYNCDQYNVFKTDKCISTLLPI